MKSSKWQCDSTLLRKIEEKKLYISTKYESQKIRKTFLFQFNCVACLNLMTKTKYKMGTEI